MGQRRYIKSCIWKDPWVEGLSPIEKLIWLYLLTNPYCSLLGIYELTTRTGAFEVGVSEEEYIAALNKFEAEGKLLRVKNWICILNFLKNQDFNQNMHFSAKRTFAQLPRELLEALEALEVYDYEALVSGVARTVSEPLENDSETIGEGLGNDYLTVGQRFVDRHSISNSNSYSTSNSILEGGVGGDSPPEPKKPKPKPKPKLSKAERAAKLKRDREAEAEEKRELWLQRTDLERLGEWVFVYRDRVSKIAGSFHALGLPDIAYQRGIEILDGYLANFPEKFLEYSDHSRVLTGWVVAQLKKEFKCTPRPLTARQEHGEEVTKRWKNLGIIEKEEAA